MRWAVEPTLPEGLLPHGKLSLALELLKDIMDAAASSRPQTFAQFNLMDLSATKVDM